MGSCVHDTFVLDKSYAKALPRVFAAFADPALKEAWYAHSPAHDKLSYALDFRPDGEERLSARMREGTPIAGKELCWTGRYIEIAENQRIVFSQTLDMDGIRLSGAIVTLEFAGLANDGTTLTLTHQAVYFDGADGPEMRRMGWQFLLDAAEAVVAA